MAKGQSSYFVWLNRGKESHVLDLALPEGRERLAELIAGADVLVQNLKPGSLARLGFAVEALRKRTRASSAARSPAMARPSLCRPQGLRPADPGGIRPLLDHRRAG